MMGFALFASTTAVFSNGFCPSRSAQMVEACDSGPIPIPTSSLVGPSTKDDSDHDRDHQAEADCIVNHRRCRLFFRPASDLPIGSRASGPIGAGYKYKYHHTTGYLTLSYN